MVSLTKRQRSIIEHLINCDDYVTLLEIATKFNVSKKTIQNDLSNIELFLNENNITLIKKQGLGIFLKANKSILDKIDVSNTYLSKEERINNIVVYLLGHNNTTYKQIADSLKVSRQTVINDFNDVINKLESLNIKVEINKSKGIKLIGKEEDIRDAYINNCLNTDFIYDDRSNKLLEELKDKYNLRFSNCNYIISVISFLFKRETKLNRKVKRNIDNEEYYKIINSYFNNENESNYLLHH